RLLHQNILQNDFIPENVIQEVSLEAQRIQSMSFEDVIKRYKVDYILWDSVKNPQWNIKNISVFKKVFSSNNITIYEIQ
ncbi:MAG: hypothetical protein ACYCZW_00450, partial [Minisyncoccota bacterium]